MDRRIGQMRMCPKDGMPLVREQRKTLLRTVEVDLCPACQGLFLDKGEIKALTGHSNLHKLLTKYLGLDSDSALTCPQCRGVMDGEDASGVRVDVCLKCFGMWLDAGELEKLRMMDDAQFRKFTPEKLEEILTAKRITREERDEAFRAALRDLALARRL